MRPTGALTITGRLATGGHGPEDVVFDQDGRVITGLADGSIVAIEPSSGARTVLGNTGGRPLGVQPCHDGSVLVCDHDRGLLRLAGDGSVDVLVDSIDGERLTFASNVVQGADGTIWFTTSTSRWDLAHYEGDIFEHSCTGRLIRYDVDGTLTVLRTGLAFGNGLVLVPDGSSLLYAESAAYSVTRYWLTGPAAGTTEPFAPNLPGFPDNMSLGSDGLLWVSIAAPRNALMDALLPRPGLIRTLVWNLPDAVRPKPVPIAWVMAFDLDGKLVHDLRLSKGGYGFVTSVAERNGTIVLGSLHEDHIALARVTAPSIPAGARR
jgi:sugar lactone lactonase YvrE